jgi:glycosyltransferase involved in cell wall biosynthesis
MNILFLSGYNINPIDGGIARITHTLAKLFIASGHSVWYLGYRKVSDDDIRRQLYFPTGKPVATTENQNFLENVIITKRMDVVIVQKNPCKAYLKMLHECKKRHNFLIISCFHNLILTQLYNYAYGVEYKLKKGKFAFIFSLLKNKWINQLLVHFYIIKNKSLYQYIVDNSDVSVVLGEGHKNELLKMIGRKFDDSIQIIPNCINETHMNKLEKTNEVLWVGNVDCSVKRIDFMIDVWDKIQIKHPDWTLRILGDGPSLQEMKDKIRISNIKNICFEGRVIPNIYYERAKILCVTSVHESFSLVTIEAKMHGVVPVVQDSFPMAREIVNNGVDGIIVRPFSLNDFCEKLDSLMDNDELIKRYSESAIISSKYYAPTRISALWKSLFANFIKKELCTTR